MQATHPKSFSPEIIPRVPGSASACPGHSVTRASFWGCSELSLTRFLKLLANDKKKQSPKEQWRALRMPVAKQWGARTQLGWEFTFSLQTLPIFRDFKAQFSGEMWTSCLKKSDLKLPRKIGREAIRMIYPVSSNWSSAKWLNIALISNRWFVSGIANTIHCAVAQGMMGEPLISEAYTWHWTFSLNVYIKKKF